MTTTSIPLAQTRSSLVIIANRTKSASSTESDRRLTIARDDNTLGPRVEKKRVTFDETPPAVCIPIPAEAPSSSRHSNSVSCRAAAEDPNPQDEHLSRWYSETEVAQFRSDFAGDRQLRQWIRTRDLKNRVEAAWRSLQPGFGRTLGVTSA
eukprot:jgi/Psemu1/303577/fgenesh1_kg.112_\